MEIPVKKRYKVDVGNDMFENVNRIQKTLHSQKSNHAKMCDLIADYLVTVAVNDADLFNNRFKDEDIDLDKELAFAKTIVDNCRKNKL